MENKRNWGYKKRIEERRLWRYWLRWLVRHHGRFLFLRMCALKTERLAFIRFRAVLARRFQRKGAERLGSLLNTSKFCNGLIGVSLTDSLPAPAI